MHGAREERGIGWERFAGADFPDRWGLQHDLTAARRGLPCPVADPDRHRIRTGPGTLQPAVVSATHLHELSLRLLASPENIVVLEGCAVALSTVLVAAPPVSPMQPHQQRWRHLARLGQVNIQ